MARRPTSRTEPTTAPSDPAVLPVRADSPRHPPLPIDEASIAVHVTALDRQGRLRLASLGNQMDWQAGHALDLIVHVGVIEVIGADAARASRHIALRVRLDPRTRLLVPVGIRALLGLRAGARVVFLASPTEGRAIGFPIAQLIDRIANAQ